LPPAGTPNIFAIYTAAVFSPSQGNKLRLFDFHVDFDTPGNSTFTERTESPLVVADFDPLNPSGRADIEQPPPATAADNLDTIGDRLMYRLQYRNRNGIESLVSVHTVNVGVHFTDHFPTPAEHQAAPRYYELRRSPPATTFSVYDQATFAPDAPTPPNLPTGLNRWMGSAAIDNQGNLAVGYSTSSAAAGEFPSTSSEVSSKGRRRSSRDWDPSRLAATAGATTPRSSSTRWTSARSGTSTSTTRPG